jgi:hypothetical protein
MKTWNATPSQLAPSTKRTASGATGPNHAATAATLCAIAVLLVLLLSQWLPPAELQGGNGSQIAEALLHTEATTVRMLRF